jgi:hypothetical protein
MKSLASALALFLPLAVAATACVSPETVVQQRAGYDLSCPPQQVAVVEIGRLQYGAEGCGKKQTYTCIAQTGQCIPDNGQKSSGPPPAAAAAR